MSTYFAADLPLPPAAGQTSADAVHLVTLPNWIKAATECRFDIAPIFRAFGVDTMLADPQSARIGLAPFERMMEACVAASRHRHFPFVLGETFTFEYMPEMETFLATSPTLRESARVFEWVRRLIYPMLRVSLEERGGEAALSLRIEPDGSRGARHDHFVESLFAAIQKFALRLGIDGASFRELRLRHPRPAYAQEYVAQFRMRVLFSQPRDELVVDRALLDRRLNGASPELHRQAERLVQRRLTQSSGPVSLSERVLEGFSIEPRLLSYGIEPMALRFGLHPRTLQRRLQNENISFFQLQDRARRDVALRSLDESEGDLASLGERLGYSERRSFTRAFKRWTGVPPSAFRRRI